MTEPFPAPTFLFSDIEGSTRLWETEPAAMQTALARHDAAARAAVAAHRGRIVKTTGDGVHAVFEAPADALAAMLALQIAHVTPDPDGGLQLRLRCGVHGGPCEERDGDYFGRHVNMAARIMSVAHGGQMLLSQAVAEASRAALPADCSLRDLGRVRLRDLSAPERLLQLLHPRLRADFPPLRSLEATPNNLVQQLSSFVNRADEFAAIGQLLQAHRLVTLLGIGGIGKSRLSAQLAAERLDDYPDGVWFVELAPLADPRLVPQELASVIGVKEEAGRPVLEALEKYVADRRMLVILDNCEHVVRACAALAKRLLQVGPALRILATSREALQVAGERVYQVPPLSVPDAAAGTSAEQLGRHHAVQLFVDRATAAQPAFRIDERSAPAVTDICRRLDGIPLAIELAAARTRALPVEAIASRILDRFRLLVSKDATVLPRQRTLRALIDWSYDLLDEGERTLFRRISVFAGGWTLEAAVAVGAADDLDPDDVPDLLGGLVEKSLVVLDAVGGRYRLLETVRQYAQERLQEAGDEAAVRERHLGWYLQFAERGQAQLWGPQENGWLARLDTEGENLLAAHAAADSVERGAELGLRLVSALRPYWIKRGLLALGLRTNLEALARPGAERHDASRSRSLADAGQLYYFMGRYAEAREQLEAGLAIAREVGDAAIVARLLEPLGMVCVGLGDFANARIHLEEAEALADTAGHRRDWATAVNALAQLDRVENVLDRAEARYAAVLPVLRELGDAESVAIALLNLAMVSLGRGQTTSVVPMLQEVFDVAERTGSVPVGQSGLEVCAALAAVSGDEAQAARFFGAAEAQAGRTGLHRDPADEAFLEPLIEAAQQALGPGFRALEDAGREWAYERAVATAREWLGTRISGESSTDRG